MIVRERRQCARPLEIGQDTCDSRCPLGDPRARRASQGRDQDDKEQGHDAEPRLCQQDGQCAAHSCGTPRTGKCRDSDERPPRASRNDRLECLRHPRRDAGYAEPSATDSLVLHDRAQGDVPQCHWHGQECFRYRVQRPVLDEQLPPQHQQPHLAALCGSLRRETAHGAEGNCRRELLRSTQYALFEGSRATSSTLQGRLRGPSSHPETGTAKWRSSAEAPHDRGRRA